MRPIWLKIQNHHETDLAHGGPILSSILSLILSTNYWVSDDPGSLRKTLSLLSPSTIWCTLVRTLPVLEPQSAIGRRHSGRCRSVVTLEVGSECLPGRADEIRIDQGFLAPFRGPDPMVM
jgi:hypothetical protein